MLHSSRDPDARVEQQPQHQGVLHVLGLVHGLVELAELVGGQDAGQPLGLGGGAQVALLPNPAADVPPVVVGQPRLPHQPGDPGDETGSRRFRLSVL